MIKYLKYKDKNYPIRLAFIAFDQFKGLTGKNLPETIEDHAKLLFIGIKTGYDFIKEPRPVPELTEEDVLWMLDEIYPKYMKVYNDSLTKLGEQFKEDTKEDKKK